jgi:hypothetical protein
MSEARNKAERIWPDFQSLQQPSLDDMYGAWSRDAFVRGAEWQARREPTEAEIEAAAGKLAEIMNSVNLGIEKYSGITVVQTVRELFATARKAVTDE